jgi:hypothetical protein
VLRALEPESPHSSFTLRTDNANDDEDEDEDEDDYWGVTPFATETPLSFSNTFTTAASS